jgi:hypothetical protein
VAAGVIVPSGGTREEQSPSSSTGKTAGLHPIACDVDVTCNGSEYKVISIAGGDGFAMTMFVATSDVPEGFSPSGCDKATEGTFWIIRPRLEAGPSKSCGMSFTEVCSSKFISGAGADMDIPEVGTTSVFSGAYTNLVSTGEGLDFTDTELSWEEEGGIALYLLR